MRLPNCAGYCDMAHATEILHSRRTIRRVISEAAHIALILRILLRHCEWHFDTAAAIVTLRMLL